MQAAESGQSKAAVVSPLLGSPQASAGTQGRYQLGQPSAAATGRSHAWLLSCCPCGPFPSALTTHQTKSHAERRARAAWKRRCRGGEVRQHRQAEPSLGDLGPSASAQENSQELTKAFQRTHQLGSREATAFCCYTNNHMGVISPSGSLAASGAAGVSSITQTSLWVLTRCTGTEQSAGS